MPQVEFDDGDIEDMDLEEFRRCSTLANVHETDDPGLIFQRPFLYVKMSFFSQVWLAYMFYVVHHVLRSSPRVTVKHYTIYVGCDIW
jgi:hypothetical protein